MKVLEHKKVCEKTESFISFISYALMQETEYTFV